MTMTVQDLKLDMLVIDEAIDFRSDKEAGLDELAASILEHGLMQPIIVSDVNGDGQYHVIAGRRRLRAFEKLGLPTIPAIVREDLSDERGRVIGQIIENLQRQDVTAMDEARAFAQLGDYGMKQKDIAATLGVSPAHVSGRLALLKLDPRIVEKVEQGKVSANVATKLARLPKAVRDKAATEPVVDDRTVARLESEHREQAARTAVVEALLTAGVKAAGAPEAWGYVGIDAMAEACGLTDDDKPKTHSWTVKEYVHRSSFEDDETFLDAATSAKGKGAYVSGTKGSLKVTILDSANVDKQRKAEQEERERELEERRAEAEAKQRTFDAALAPIIAAPDKAKILLSLLFAAIQERIAGAGYRQGDILVRALGRLDLLNGEDEATVEECEAKILAYAQKSATDAMRVLLALSTHVDRLLLQQGINVPLADYANVYEQIEWYREGLVTLDEISEAAQQRIEEEDRQAAMSEEEADAEFDELLIARMEQALLAKMAEDGLDPDEHEDWPYSEEEIAAVEATVRAALDAEVSAE